jgi:Domain of unknown function (DUF4129)
VLRAVERRLQQLAQRPFLLAASVIMLLAIGGAGLGFRNQIELGQQGFRPDLSPTFLVLAVCCVITFFVVLAAMPKNRPGGPPPTRRNPWAMALGLATIALLFFLATRVREGLDDGRTPAETMPGVSGTPVGGNGSGTYVQGEHGGLIALTVMATIAAIGLVMWSRRERPQITDQQTDAEDLRQVIAAGQTALSGQTDARSAVIAAYAAMETALARAGVQRRIADTPSEVLARAGKAGLFGPAAAAAAAELTELFERARFSDRPMPLGAREYAERALAGMDADLEAAIARAAEAKAEEVTAAGAR